MLKLPSIMSKVSCKLSSVKYSKHFSKPSLFCCYKSKETSLKFDIFVTKIDLPGS